ncbi:ABC transporter ATP-binding protein [Streptomyces milbemycinicus]|uniref:ABC transporter ATP-binding protein n=1 Tax=Streptomyces milbemycinicus TaxID=476552 RepID=UPI0033CFF065
MPALLSGQLTALAIDDGLAQGRPGTAVRWLATLAFCYLVAAIGTRHTFPALADVVEPLRDRLLARTVAGTLHAAAAGTSRPDASAVSRLTRQVETVRDVTAGMLVITRQFVVTLSAAALGMFMLAPHVLLLVLPSLTAGLLLFGALTPVLRRRHDASVQAEEQVAAESARLLDAIRDITACGAHHPARRDCDGWTHRHASALKGLGRASAMRSLVVVLGVYLPMFLVFVQHDWLVRHGMSTGEFVGAAVYLTSSLEPTLRSFVQATTGSGLKLVVNLRRLLPITAHSDDHVVPPGRRGSTRRRHGPPAAVSCDSVRFRYGAASAPVLDNLSLEIPAGGHLAVIGPSGIGKSTLAHLIAGVALPEQGALSIGDSPVTGLRPDVVLVPQEAYVFAGTLADNVRYLVPDATDEHVGQALRAVGADALSARLGGPASVITPVNLANGERQLIAAARAYLAAAPVTVLDEATSGLDPLTESRVEAAFQHLPGTLVVVAHRLSSALRAGQILLLDGRSYHLGTHEELLDTSPLYRELSGHWR